MWDLIEGTSARASEVPRDGPPISEETLARFGLTRPFAPPTPLYTRYCLGEQERERERACRVSRQSQRRSC